MKILKLAWIAPLVLVTGQAFGQAQDDNRAVPRGSTGGSGGGSSASSDSGSRHTGSSSSGSSASSGSDSRSAGSTRSESAPSAAGRRPRPGTGTGDRRGSNQGDRYVGSPYSGYYYDPYGYSYGLGYRYRPYGYSGYGYGYYDYGYGYGDYSGYYPSSGYRTYRYREGNISQIRTLVEPAKTRVYVDGYYAGIVDDFDGLLQRLNVSPGRHEISLKLEGYQAHTFAIYANREQTLKLRWDMVRGNGETRDSIGDVGDRDERDSGRDAEREDRDSDRRADPAERNPNSDADRAEKPYAPPSRGSDRGELFLDVQPADASVYVDGEFYGKASEVTRLELPNGRHRVEVVRPGYKTEEKEVDIERTAARVTVKLERR